MPTIITSKKKFLEEMDALIDDDEVVLRSTELHSMESSTKGVWKRIRFIWSGLAFKKSGVKPLMEGLPTAFLIVKREVLSPDAIAILERA